MSLKHRIGRLENNVGEPDGVSLEAKLVEARDTVERLGRMDTQALLELVYDGAQKESTRNHAFSQLRSRDVGKEVRMELLKMEQTMAEADLKGAQDREITAVTRKGRKFQEQIQLAGIRGATHQLERIGKDMLAIRA